MRLQSIVLPLALAGCAGSNQQPLPTAAPGQLRPGQPELGSFGLDLSTRDLTVKAGDDFYRHANGKWLDSYELKPDETHFGTFIALRYRSEERVKTIIQEAAHGNPPQGSIEQKIGDYYASYMDMETRNKGSIEPLRGDLERLDRIADRRALVQAFGRAPLDGSASPIGIDVDIDAKRPDRYILDVHQSGLGLPDRDYYLEDNERFVRIRAAYQNHIARMLQLTGWDAARSSAAAQRVLALETTMAGHHWPRTDLRDRDKTYNLYTLKRIETEFAGYDWRAHLSAEGAGEPEELIVSTPTAIRPLLAVLDATPLETWKEYLRFHLVRNHASYLSTELDDASFDFVGKVLGGQQTQRDRWKRAVNLVGDLRGLGEAIGQVYVKRYFPPSSKAMMVELVEDLRAAFRQRIQQLDWMGEDTKQEALAKLAAFRAKIGYPEKWRDLTAIEIRRDDLVANVKAVRGFFHRYDMQRLHRPADKDEWFMTPQYVNAYYNAPFNEIVFPAAILQPPFFDPHADPAVNYGAIGAVIGHEMGHGFDDQGSKVDSAGVQRNWWTDDDRHRFEERTKELVAQYDAYTPVEGQSINGELTQGENIGDLGGLSIAYRAYELFLNGTEPPVVDGLTGPQRFFLSWSQVWRSKQREQYLVMQLKSDPHSPPRYRVSGVVRNIGAWYDAFDVQPHQASYLPPGSRVSIW